jgi:hypothetical protein
MNIEEEKNNMIWRIHEGVYRVYTRNFVVEAVVADCLFPPSESFGEMLFVILG